MNIVIKVRGVAELKKLLSTFGPKITEAMRQHAPAIVAPILRPRGDGDKQTYPPQTAANNPPTPFYRRGIGVQLKSRIRPVSQQMHMRFVVKAEPLKITLTNTASYARYVIGEPPARKMTAKGWRSLYALAQARIGEITKAMAAAVTDILRNLGRGQHG